MKTEYEIFLPIDFNEPLRSVFADMLNLTNENAEQDVRSTLVTSDVYQYPSSFPSPRRVMIGVKGSF